ncbi:thioredoxin-disulfide reductase [Patescibacteria group bacterium]|nr:thioredoxin-disulfide reductase [Patescibacteria group bacterium]MCG2701678.1 thioredoxin-disulfide reductase [Candidatus Parcubacteria bacterium]MBU4210088.1 thioredoxin-disulfide reductase [Patescibacteria group bacterium]MBU4265387.1 thioredoxin-disulfide reductase [Patescibacteria group bacterium]MBU4390339.1 thioredoxin-disulfide reductase [Patescibacteria group bacterium]
MNESKRKYDVVIIGSGPAGLTAGIYAVRAGLKAVVASGDQPGGQLTITAVVENYPGFPNGIGGIKLMMDMQKQVENLGGEIKQGIVKKILKIQKNFGVKLKNNGILETKTVIVATGSKARWLGIEKEKELIGRGVSGCATCDGMFFGDKVVAVTGGGNTACEEAVFLSRFAKKVYLIHRRNELRATKIEQKRVFENKKIEVVWSTEVKELLGDEKLEKIKIVNNKTGKERIIEIDGLFVAIGSDPATKFLTGLVEMEKTGHIKVGVDKKYSTMTSVDGIFGAGDCVNNAYKQGIVAAGMGCKAALDMERWLKE